MAVVPPNVQAAYDDLVSDKYRRDCLTLPDSGECVDCLQRERTSYSHDILSSVCLPPAPESPRKFCNVDDLNQIIACPGGLQVPHPPGVRPVVPSKTSCSSTCNLNNLPTCVTPRGPLPGARGVNSRHYLKQISKACQTAEPADFSWGTPLTCSTVDADDNFVVNCKDAQWGVQVNNIGSRWGGTDDCVGMASNDTNCEGSTKGGTCSDSCLTNVFFNTKLYNGSTPTGQRVTTTGGTGSAYRTVKIPIDEIIFDGDTISRDCTVDSASRGHFSCPTNVGTGYGTIMCNSKETRIPLGKFPCPEVDCVAETIGHIGNTTYSHCYCNPYVEHEHIENHVGDYIIGKLILPNANQTTGDRVQWKTCQDQSLATDRTVDQFIGDDDRPN